MDAASLFNGKTWIIYGRLGMLKKDITSAIIFRGGRVVSSISYKVDFLVWDGETLVPGDSVTSVKPSQLLKLGGVVVGEQNFVELLKGKVAMKLEQYLESNPERVAPAKPKKPKKPKAPSKPIAETLLERSREAVANVNYFENLVVVDQVVALCIGAGRLDVAVPIVDSLPVKFQGPGRIALALAGEGSIDSAVDLVLSGIEAIEAYERPKYVARALELAADLEGKSERATDLRGPAEAVVDAAFDKGDFKLLGEIVRAHHRLNDKRWIQRILPMWLEQDPESLGEALKDSDLVWTFSDDAPKTLALVNAMSDINDRIRAIKCGKGLENCLSWSLDDLNKLVALVRFIRMKLGKALLKSGRTDDARHILFNAPEWDSFPMKQVRRHLLFGETDAARQLLSGAPPYEVRAWTRFRIEHGIESIADARERYLKDHKTHGSVMRTVESLVLLANDHLNRKGDLAEVEPFFEAIEDLLALETRTHYDRGVETSNRSKVATLRARFMSIEGDSDRLRAGLESDLKNLKTILNLAQDKYQKNDAVQSLVRRALTHGFPELALKAAKKVTMAARPDKAPDVALGFLPGDPAKALAALDVLAKTDANYKLLTPSYGKTTPLLVALWAAVLSQAS